MPLFKTPRELSGPAKEVIGGVLGGAAFGIPLTIVNLIGGSAGGVTTPFLPGVLGVAEGIGGYAALGKMGEERENFMHGFWLGGTTVTFISAALAIIDAAMLATGGPMMTPEVAQPLARRFGVDINTLQARVARVASGIQTVAPGATRIPSVGTYRRLT